MNSLNIANWIKRAGLARPNSPAVGHGNKVVQTYDELSQSVASIAGSLNHQFQLKPGQRVAIISANTPQYIEAIFAIWHAGLIAVPINAKLHPKELEFILSNADVSLCFVGADISDKIQSKKYPVISFDSPEYTQLRKAQALPIFETKPDDTAWIFYTSGTTGKPKGAMLSHRSLIAMSLNYFNDFDKVEAGDTIIHPAPLSHGAGLWMLPHVCAMACNVIPKSGGFDCNEIFDLIQHWPNVSMFAAPTMVRRLTLHETTSGTDNLKLIIYGGAPMYVTDCMAALKRFGPKLAQLYGQGESPMTITHLPRQMLADNSHPNWKQRLGTVGIPDSCVTVKVVDKTGRELPIGETGEIIVAGDTVMTGYWNNPQATNQSLKNGWLYTGDIGYFNENGFLTLTDRAKDLIISGGSNIYPREIEEVLLTVNGVEEVSVISRHDEDWGEIVVAYIVGKVDESVLNAHCIANIARFKRPKIYRFIDELPKNNYGKVLKTKLRAREKTH